jgi:hypothetical protein
MAKTEKTSLTPSWDLAGQSVRLVRSHFTPFMYLILLPGLLYSLGGLLMGEFITPEGQFVPESIHPTGVIVTLVAMVWMLVNLGPSTHLKLDASRHKPKLIREYYRSGLPDTLKLVALYFLMGLAILIGLLAFIIPGIIALRAFILAPYFMVDNKLSVLQSLKTAARGTKPFSSAVWGVIGVQIAVTFTAAFLGTIPILGMILSLALSYSIAFILALRYQTIQAAQSTR